MLASHAEIPSGTIPSNMCSDTDLRGCGLDPVHVRQLENELAEMGLGLGISIGGLFRGIGRGIGKVAKRGFKVGRGAARIAAPIATQFIPGPVGGIARQLIGGGGGPGGPPPGPPPWEYGQPSSAFRSINGHGLVWPTPAPVRPGLRRGPFRRPRVPGRAELASIPRSQTARVALYEQRFGPFGSGKNAYWSLMAGRPVTLAEGAQFDVDRRAGRPTPTAGVPPVARVAMPPRMPPGPTPYPVVPPKAPSLEERIAGIVGRILPAVPQVIEAIAPGALPPAVPAVEPRLPPSYLRPAPAAPSPVVITAPGAPAAAPAAMPPWLIPALLGVGALVILPQVMGRKSA